MTLDLDALRQELRAIVDAALGPPPQLAPVPPPTRCKKAIHCRTRAEAELSARLGSFGNPVYPYWCKEHRCWHLTSRPQPPQRTRPLREKPPQQTILDIHRWEDEGGMPAPVPPVRTKGDSHGQ